MDFENNLSFRDNEQDEINSYLCKHSSNEKINLDGILLNKGQLESILNMKIYDYAGRQTLPYFTVSTGGDIELTSVFQAKNKISNEASPLTDYAKENKKTAILMERDFCPGKTCISHLMDYLINCSEKGLELFVIPITHDKLYKYSYEHLLNKKGKKTNFLKINEKIFNTNGEEISNKYSPIVSEEEAFPKFFKENTDKDKNYFITAMNFDNYYKYYYPSEKGLKKIEKSLKKREKKI